MEYPPNSNLPESHVLISIATKAIMVYLGLNNLTPADHAAKKAGLALAVAVMIAIGEGNEGRVSPVFGFLYVLVGFEVVFIGAALQMNTKRIPMLLMILVNVVGFIWALKKKYVWELLHPDIIKMLGGTCLAFIGIWALGRIF